MGIQDITIFEFSATARQKGILLNYTSIKILKIINNIYDF